MTTEPAAASATSTIQSAVAGMQGELLAVGGTAVGIGAAVLILTRGWGVLKRIAK